MPPSSCSINATTLAAKLPRHLKDGKAFHAAPFRQAILVYDTKNSMYFDPGSETLLPELLSIKVGGRSSPQSVVLHKGNMLCALAKGGLELMVKDIRGMGTFSKIQLKVYRSAGATAIDTPNGVFICGGSDRKGNLTGACDLVGVTRASVINMPSIRRPRSYSTAVYVRGEIYVIGGYYMLGQRCGWTDIFDTETLQWRQGPGLKNSRSSCCAVVLHDRWIVVLGGDVGSTGASTTREVELLDTTDTSSGWFIGGKMGQPRKKFSAVAVENNVYLFGGGVAEIERMKISIVEPSARIAPSIAEQQTMSLGTNGDKKPVASVKKKPDAAQGAPSIAEQKPSKASNTGKTSAATVVKRKHDAAVLQTRELTSTIEINVDMFPEPPALPEVRPCFTVANRIDALEGWTREAEALQAEFVARLSNSVELLKEAFDTVRDLKIKQMEQRSSEWLDDTQRKIQKVHEDVAQNKILLKEASSSLLAGKDLDDYADNVPSQLRCPITLTLMVDPVVASDGITYERTALQVWLKKEQTSPLTGAPLESTSMFPTLLIKSLCDEFAKHHDEC